MNVPTALCQKIWNASNGMRMQSLVITLPQKGNQSQCQNYQTISLISHPSKVMLKVIQNCLTLMAQELQASCRACRSRPSAVVS